MQCFINLSMTADPSNGLSLQAVVPSYLSTLTVDRTHSESRHKEAETSIADLRILNQTGFISSVIWLRSLPALAVLNPYKDPPYRNTNIAQTQNGDAEFSNPVSVALTFLASSTHFNLTSSSSAL